MTSENAGQRTLVSIIVTVRNEEKNIRDLLDSLVVQEPPIEIIIVDAFSEDRTEKIVASYAERYDCIHLHRKGGMRGDSRNYGVSVAKGDIIAFTDGDCIANPFWVHEIRMSMRTHANSGGSDDAEVGAVAGRTITMGYQPFVELDRVELIYRGMDLTYPSCNIAYWKSVFHAVSGFDPKFVTAEDIDLNYRVVTLGNRIIYNENMIIYHRARSTFVGFFKQAFWNGFGRKQLTMKHGAFWGKYKPSNMLRHSFSFWYGIRLLIALLGYFAGIMYAGKMK